MAIINRTALFSKHNHSPNTKITAAIVEIGREKIQPHKTIMHERSRVAMSPFQLGGGLKGRMTSSRRSPSGPIRSWSFSGSLPVTPHIWGWRTSATPSFSHSSTARFTHPPTAVPIIPLLLLLNVDPKLILKLRRLEFRKNIDENK